MFTWAQLISEILRLISVTIQWETNLYKKKKAGIIYQEETSCYSNIQCLHRVKIPEVQFELGYGEQSSGATTGFLFLIQVEGAAQECSSGSESRHPDGWQMLENISEQHVHFS